MPALAQAENDDKLLITNTSAYLFFEICEVPKVTSNLSRFDECGDAAKAVAAATSVVDDMFPEHQSLACAPEGISPYELLSIGQRYFRDHPELRDVRSGDLLTAAGHLEKPMVFEACA